MPNLTLDDFYNPTVTSITKVIMDITFMFQIMMLPFILYAIIKKSGKIEIYRWYLLNDTIWSSLLSFCFAFYSPTLLGVYPMLMVNSFFEHWFSIEIWYTIADFCLYCLINTTTALCFTIAYRYLSAFKTSSLKRFEIFFAPGGHHFQKFLLFLMYSERYVGCCRRIFYVLTITVK
jgi:adenosine deaminase